MRHMRVYNTLALAEQGKFAEYEYCLDQLEDYELLAAIFILKARILDRQRFPWNYRNKL